jgi:hypothetical protein
MHASQDIPYLCTSVTSSIDCSSFIGFITNLVFLGFDIADAGHAFGVAADV